MTSVPSYHVRGTHIDKDGEDGTSVDTHVNFGLVNHHRRSYRDVAANVKDTSGPDGINDDILYRDSPAAATEDESAAMRLNNLRSGRKHGAFRAWESHDRTSSSPPSSSPHSTASPVSFWPACPECVGYKDDERECPSLQSVYQPTLALHKQKQ